MLAEPANTPLILDYPVRSHTRELICPEGTVLSAATMCSLPTKRPSASRSVSLLEYGNVKADILRFLGQPPYELIFSDKEETEGLLGLIGDVKLDRHTLETVDYFKDNDPVTYQHILNVFILSTLLIKDLLPNYQEFIQHAAEGPNHDIGKISVPLSILKKEKPLTHAERKALEHHAVAGYVHFSHLLGDPQHLAACVARDHHERRDGSGYPSGVSLKDRMVEIVGVSDVYDALISPRPYRSRPYDNRTALEEVTRMAENGKIGWDVVKALVARNRTDKSHYSRVVVATDKRGTPPPDNVYGIFAKDGEAASHDSAD